MDTRSLAHPAHEPTTTRTARALRLYEERADEIVQIAPGIYCVPSQDGERSYRVHYGATESCECPDHTYRGVSCVHIYAVGIAAAKGTIRHPEVLAGDPFAYEGYRCRCYGGWVFLGFEGEDEDGEHVEVIERVPCKRCKQAR